MTLPITITCAVFADDMILVLLGPKWMDAVVIFRLLSPTILVFAMINPMWWLLVSTGLVERSLKIALVIAPLTITAYFIGLPHGPGGVAFAYSAVMTLWLIPHLAWCLHGTMISLGELIRTMRRPFISAIVAAALSFGVQYSCAQWLTPFSRLVLGGTVLFGSYLWMLLYVMGQKAFYLDLLRGLRRRSSANGKESVGVL
jgi:PST family polysaccharide transporter